MKAYDLKGQHFGRWTVLYKCNYLKTNHYPWHCICECGKEKDVNTRDLISGKSQSCGCLQKEKAKQIGKKTISIAQAANRKNLKGQQFGRLIVLYSLYDENGEYKQYCQCECGNFIKVKTHDLISGNTMSCGCLKSRGQEKISKILNENNISFEVEKSFDDCVYPDTLSKCFFDFYVNDKYIIEYDGIQHFQENEFFQLSLSDQKKRDKFKNKWCKFHNIPIIRIPYIQLNNLSYKDLDLMTSDFIIK